MRVAFDNGKQKYHARCDPERNAHGGRLLRKVGRALQSGSKSAACSVAGQ